MRFGELRQKAPNLEVKFLEESLVFLMLELLRVLGVLTGEILTPGLHAELRKVQVQSADEGGRKDMSGPGEPQAILRLETGIPNLDAIFHGGLPKGAMTVLAGPPGSGKTILTQQICFHHASQGGRVLYFNTLSEPTAKTLLYLRPFAFFNPRLLNENIRFIDLGLILRTKGLELTCNLLMEHIKQFKPSMVVIDSFRVFDDLAHSTEELRKFTYELTVRLMAWECTTFLLGEYSPTHFEHPAYSIIDGIITARQFEMSGEQQRMLQVIKLRGTSHSRDEHPFVITDAGVEVYAPGITLRRHRRLPQGLEESDRMKTGISKLDGLLGAGIPAARASSCRAWRGPARPSWDWSSSTGAPGSRTRRGSSSRSRRPRSA